MNDGEDNDDSENNNNDDDYTNKSDSVNSGSLEMDMMTNLVVKNNGRRKTAANTVLNDAEQIENEIDKLKKENNLFNNAEREQRQIVSSSSLVRHKGSFGAAVSTSVNSNNELANSSLQASRHFDQKLEHIENYSQIIENATLKMDACVKDMNIVYENYEKIYDESSAAENEERDEVADRLRAGLNLATETPRNINYDQDEELSVYDLSEKIDVTTKAPGELVIIENEHRSGGVGGSDTVNAPVTISSRSSPASFQTNDEALDRDHYSVTSSTYKSNFRSENENNYLDDSDSVNLEDVKQEIK
jgi:hypothetical protein